MLTKNVRASWLAALFFCAAYTRRRHLALIRPVGHGKCLT